MTEMDALEQFVHKVLNIHFPNCEGAVLTHFHNNSDFGKGGFGSLESIHVLDQQNQLLLIAKAETITEQEAQHISLLVPASDLLRKLPLIRGKLILPIAAESVSINGKNIQFTAIEAAKGNSIPHYISEYAQGQISLVELLYMVKDVALALGEMNSIVLSSTSKLSSVHESEEDRIVGVFILYMEEHPEWFPFSVETFKAAFEKKLIQAYSQPFPIGIIHGDSNITNIFYDPTSKWVQFIDSLCVFQSVDLQGKPIGNIAHEYARTLLSFQLMAKYYKLNEEAVDQLKRVFIENYPLKITPEHLSYYSLLFWMAYTIITYKVGKGRPNLTAELTELRSYCINEINIFILI